MLFSFRILCNCLDFFFLSFNLLGKILRTVLLFLYNVSFFSEKLLILWEKIVTLQIFMVYCSLMFLVHIPVVCIVKANAIVNYDFMGLNSRLQKVS